MHVFTPEALKPFEGVAVDFAVYRIMYQFFDKGVLDEPRKDNVRGDVRTQQHANLTRHVAEHSMVLLKNDMPRNQKDIHQGPALPLDVEHHHNFHLVGDQFSKPVYAGGGSGQVHENSVKTPLDYLCELFNITKFDTDSQTCSVKHCSEKTRKCITFTPFLDNAGGNPYRSEKCDFDVNDEFFDATIMGAGIQSSEGADRQNLEWDIQTYKAAVYVAGLRNPGRKIAHLVAPGASIIGFDHIFDGILYSVMPGQEMSEALFNTVFGWNNPSGKLTFTMPNKENEQNFTQAQWPGLNDNVTYSEHEHFGYRYYDLMGIKPQYEFGFGLSYTRHHYDNLRVTSTPEGVMVNLTVTNVGPRDGAEIVQVYLAKPKTENYSDMYRSPQDLRGFTKVFIPRGRSEEVSVLLKDLDFSYWNTTTHLFTVEPGHYGVRVGASSRDIRLNTTIEIK